MSYNQNPMFMPTTRPPSQGYPPYGGPGKPPVSAAQGGAYQKMYVVQGSPYMNQQCYAAGTDGGYPGSGRSAAEANAAQVMVGVPVYQGQYMQAGSGIVGNAPQMLRPLQVYPGGHIPLGTPAQSHPASYGMAISQQQAQQQPQPYYKGGYMPSSHPPPPQPQQQQALPSGAAASVSKRKKNIIQIIDPNTGQEVKLTAGQENKTSTNDAEPAVAAAAASSAAAAAVVAPASIDSSQWGAQFAAQVAATLDPVAPRDNKLRPATATAKLPPSSDAEATSSQKTGPMAEPAASADVMAVGQAQLPELTSAVVEAAAAGVTPVEEAASLATSGSVPPDADNKTSPLASAAVHCDDKVPGESTQVEPNPSDESTCTQPNPPDISEQPQQLETSSPDDLGSTKATKASSKTTAVKTNPQQPPQMPSQQQQPIKPVAAAAASTASETVPPDANGNKKKNRKKNKDLNTKGKVLQGSDMDAFIDEASKSDGQKGNSKAGKSSEAVEESEVISEPETSAQTHVTDDAKVSTIYPDDPQTTSPADPSSAPDSSIGVSDNTIISKGIVVSDDCPVIADGDATVTDSTADGVAADGVVLEEISKSEKTEPVESCPAVCSDEDAADMRAPLADVGSAIAAAAADTGRASSAEGDALSTDSQTMTSIRLPSDADASEKTSPAAELSCESDEKMLEAVPLANNESKEETVAETVASDPTDDAESSSGSGTELETAAADKPAKTQLKYTYSEDQWSPLNPEGKKQYDRNFMLQLQFANPSIVKPVGLPSMLDIILNEPRAKAEFSKQLSNDPMSPIDFTPGFIKQSLGGGGSGGGNRGPQRRGGGGSAGGGGGGGGGGGMKRGNDQQQQQQQQQQRRVITLEHNITLHTTQNAWKPVISKAKETEIVTDTEELYKKIRGILNKLTPQKFATLIQKVQDLPIDSEERLTGCINIIFEKAISEPNFSVAYANMAKCLINISVPLESDPNEKVGFRKLLLNKCQQEFEKDKAEQLDIDHLQSLIDEANSEEKRKQLTDERNSMMSRAKRRSLGNIRFIGELFRLRMLTEKIMHECLGKLLRSGSDEDSLECLCQLLRTIGIEIDKKQQSQVFVNKYFAELQGLVEQKKTSARLRFMILDVIDLRKNKWIPRRDNNNPKTIEQIHKEAEQEEQEKQLALQKFNQEQRGRRGPPPPRSAGPPVSSTGSHAGDDGWTAVGRAPKSIVDPARMKLTKQPMDENVQLGPGGRGMSVWSRGSSGGLKTLSQESDRPMPTPNRFSALGFGSESMDARSRPGGRGAYTGRLSGPQGRAPASRQSQEKTSNEASYRASGVGRVARSPSGSSRSASQEIRSAREKASSIEQFMPPTAKDEKEVSEAEVEKKTKSLMEEYLHGHDIKEAALCVKELGSRSLRHFVYHSLLQNLERTPQARNFTGKLHLYLVRTRQMKIEHYVEGLRSILEFADEMVIDIPLIWDYLGELISPMIEDGTVSPTFLRAACEPLLACDKAGIVVGHVLHEVERVLGQRGAGELWQKSGLRWTDFMKPSAVDSFLENQKLQFTVESSSAAAANSGSLSSSLSSVGQLQEQLTAFLSDSKTDKRQLVDWISERVDKETSQTFPFIRAFTTSICSACLRDKLPSQRPDESKVDSNKLKECMNALAQYVKHDAQLELQVLFATQSFVHKLEHPPGMLLEIWTVLYDEDVISEASFDAWKNNSDPSEAGGKGVALSSVKQFFQWIEKEEPGNEDDPDS